MKFLCLFYSLFFFNLAQALPSFNDYQVKRWIEIPKNLKFADKKVKLYKTVITNALKEGINFAGDSQIVIIGCGTSCANFALVNWRTKTAFFSPTYIVTVPSKYDPKEDTIEYKTDSSLLILRGCLNESERCGDAYFKWDGKKLSEIDFVKK